MEIPLTQDFGAVVRQIPSELGGKSVVRQQIIISGRRVIRVTHERYCIAQTMGMICDV